MHAPVFTHSLCPQSVPTLPLLQAFVLPPTNQRDRISLSTKVLEPTPGDMLQNKQLVYASAEATGAAFKERAAADRRRTVELKMQGEVAYTHASAPHVPLPHTPVPLEVTLLWRISHAVAKISRLC